MQSNRLRVLMEVAIFAVFSLILDLFIPSTWALNISFKMLPVVIIALRRGTIPGVLSGFLWGFLQFAVGNAHILTISQFLLEYFVAFALIGLAGVLSVPLKNTLRMEPERKTKHVVLAGTGLVIGSFARYVIHFIAGYIFWGQYAPEGQSAVLYSFLVNISAFSSETLTTLFVLILLAQSYKRLILVEN